MAAGSSSNWVMESAHDVPHVLAVDDNLIDRKLVEKLLRNSSCKGTPLEQFYTFLMFKNKSAE